ncbi:MAG: ABC-F family ATP-binding cassette domain-containing protein, partial [Firmicutes bacterium]|nr:ABC-F family ATP-binding cassette domain-containing protein [Bacillota bacterium]
MLVRVERVSFGFAGEPLLSDVSFTIHRGDRIGLVGLNGCGKTTLLQIVAGSLRPHRGRVMVARGVRVRYVGSLGEPAPESSLRDFLTEPLGELVAMEQELQRLAQELATAPPERQASLLEAYGELVSAFERRGGYQVAERVRAVTETMGLAGLLEHPMGSLSAGQRARAALGRALLDDADVLLLDEPTEHLDLAARVWLERHLAGSGRTFVLVSHDRAFLDACVTRILHLEDGHLRAYSGGYSAFEARRALERETARAAYEERARTVRRLEERARQYRQWAQAVEATK